MGANMLKAHESRGDIPLGDWFLSGAGIGRSCGLRMRVPNPSVILDKNCAPMGPDILSSIGTGVWRNRSSAFPRSEKQKKT